ncbi:MAG: hypothetical protein NC213_10220 [Acetobacter sp.]|nr:hypothetical protein [Bacteroides sp.]MCM1342109.1 hypothetical protein [Acetobacter sp.]MCM1434314.1 hypothetical protein [Clostridiales bacterium]
MANIENTDEKIVGIESNMEIKDLLKSFVNETIKYSQEQSKLIKEFLKKKVKYGKFTFRYPFILKEKNVIEFQNLIKDQLSIKYNSNYELSFLCQVEFKNNDKIICNSIDELFNVSHEQPIHRLHLIWTYIIEEQLEMLTLPVEYEVQVFYEIEQDSDQKELYTMEEWGIVLVENSETAWINETLQKMRNLVDATKMPFWWYYPRKFFLAIREYVNYSFYIVGIFIATIIYNLSTNKDSHISDFINKISGVSDTSEKLQMYIEYTLQPKDYKSLWIMYIAIIIFGGILGMIFSKFSRYIFPKSIILIGNMKNKLLNKYRAYGFIWGPIVLSVLGGIVALLKQLFF